MDKISSSENWILLINVKKIPKRKKKICGRRKIKEKVSDSETWSEAATTQGVELCGVGPTVEVTFMGAAMNPIQ